MGKLLKRYLCGPDVYRCVRCLSHLTLQSALESTAFRSGPHAAMLFAQCVNISQGPPEERMLTTGLHTCRDIYCIGCDSEVGWTYITAYEQSQKYKEGKYILVEDKVLKPAQSSRQSTDAPPAPHHVASTIAASLSSSMSSLRSALLAAATAREVASNENMDNQLDEEEDDLEDEDDDDDADGLEHEDEDEDADDVAEEDAEDALADDAAQQQQQQTNNQESIIQQHRERLVLASRVYSSTPSLALHGRGGVVLGAFNDVAEQTNNRETTEQ